MPFVQLSSTVKEWIRRADTSTLTTKLDEYSEEGRGDELSPRDTEMRYALRNAIKVELLRRKAAHNR